MKRTRTEITIEIDEVIHASGPGSRFRRAWCPACQSEVIMTTPEQAAAIAKVRVRTINQGVENGRVHFLETREGLLLVCVNSLDLNEQSNSEV